MMGDVLVRPALELAGATVSTCPADTVYLW